MIVRALVAASTKPMILAILRHGENYGYQIIQSVREASGGQLDWSEPMLYPVLHRMERDGLIRSQWRTSDRGRLRKYFRLTELGLAELDREKSQWLTVHAALSRFWDPLPGIRG